MSVYLIVFVFIMYYVIIYYFSINSSAVGFQSTLTFGAPPPARAVAGARSPVPPIPRPVAGTRSPVPQFFLFFQNHFWKNSCEK